MNYKHYYIIGTILLLIVVFYHFYYDFLKQNFENPTFPTESVPAWQFYILIFPLLILDIFEIPLFVGSLLFLTIGFLKMYGLYEKILKRAQKKKRNRRE